jgi:hypothetical protein
MNNLKSNFWTGLVLGSLGGFVAAKRFYQPSRMPCAASWQKILTAQMGEVKAASFIADVERYYFQLFDKRSIFNDARLNFHIVRMLLPGVALYHTFQQYSESNAIALAEVGRVYKSWFENILPLGIKLDQLTWIIPKNFTAYQHAVRFITDMFFPRPGWKYELVEQNNYSFAFNMNECFYIKLLKNYDAVELTQVFCRLDDYLMDSMPKFIKWGRTQTMGFGAECCNFHWNLDTENINPQAQVMQSPIE